MSRDNFSIIRRIGVACALALATAIGAVNQTESGRSYIKKWAPTAVDEMRRSGVPASITLAQGLLESGNGKSDLAVNANNHFGIKCHDWKGEKVYKDAETKNECYRKYSSAESSFQDHSDFLRYRDRYKFLFDLETTDYKGWAYGLRKAGYATDPKYPEKLIAIIEAYDLTQYDRGVATPQTPTVLESPTPFEGGEVFNFSLSRRLYSQNRVPFVYSMDGESYRSIAEDNNLFLREILKYNDLDQDKSLAPGTIVYLHPKKNKATSGVDKYVAEGGETMWQISQRFGIKLNKLLKMNAFSKSYELQPEDVVNLR